MTEQDAIDAALALKEFCCLRGCADGDYKCPFLDTHNRKNYVCRISERFPADWDIRGLKHEDENHARGRIAEACGGAGE